MNIFSWIESCRCRLLVTFSPHSPSHTHTLKSNTIARRSANNAHQEARRKTQPSNLAADRRRHPAKET
ncbi:Hypothetical predicted protein [Cloeon dipterum]|uniref:Uncharacterized protein n=1 Tax=Cloeon dipterum TaxID=197152 RepID=A0A8S1CXE0_9INSE|nr:Hypothetical predicted protein [Cloeon dipterum]